MSLYELVLGSVGSLLLATSGVPQIIRSLRLKNVTGLSPYSLSCVFLGCVCMNLFILSTQGLSILNISYTLNSIFSCTNLMLYLRYKK